MRISAIDWRANADRALTSGDSDEAEACVHEAQQREKTIQDLRGALRFVAIDQ